jgi:regulator of protease activity HflC (stomatin/prohibitin superfamily)
MADHANRPASKVVTDESELTSNSPDTDRRRMWGWVSAKPSEYLIVYRNGKLVEPLCGQGGQFFKWPADTYVLVPTTLKEVVFQANQVTTDFVDVRVRGMVVYRITDPQQIYRLINFADRPRAEAKLARMLGDMCRSTVKWLVANMKLEEANRKRKEEIAEALKKEVATVTSDDWGVEIVTIDIQDIYIQDANLFSSMQSGFMADKDREASLARMEAKLAIERRRLATETELEKSKQDLALEKAQREAQVQLANIEFARKREEEQFKLDQQRAQQAREVAMDSLREQQARAELEARGERDRAMLRAEVLRIEHDEEMRAMTARFEAENSAGRASLERLFITQALPALSEAIAHSMEGARLNIYQANGAAGGPNGAQGPSGLVPLVFGQVMDLLQQRLSSLPPPAAPKEE